MTEQEYIDLSDLQRLKSARAILNNIMPSISKIIDEKSFREVRKILWDFQEKLTDEVSIKQ